MHPPSSSSARADAQNSHRVCSSSGRRKRGQQMHMQLMGMRATRKCRMPCMHSLSSLVGTWGRAAAAELMQLHLPDEWGLAVGLLPLPVAALHARAWGPVSGRTLLVSVVGTQTCSRQMDARRGALTRGRCQRQPGARVRQQHLMQAAARKRVEMPHSNMQPTSSAMCD